MELITKPGELVDHLFRELDVSYPPQRIQPSFLHRVAGLCFGVAYSHCCGEPPYLTVVLAAADEMSGLNRSGVKLIALAEALANERCFDPAQDLRIDRLIRLMVEALGSSEIELRCEVGARRCKVISSRAYESRRNVRIRVTLDEE
jgi:hypothetical protein